MEGSLALYRDAGAASLYGGSALYTYREDCTVRSNALWVLVTWDLPLHGQNDGQDLCLSISQMISTIKRV